MLAVECPALPARTFEFYETLSHNLIEFTYNDLTRCGLRSAAVRSDYFQLGLGHLRAVVIHRHDACSVHRSVNYA